MLTKNLTLWTKKSIRTSNRRQIGNKIITGRRAAASTRGMFLEYKMRQKAGPPHLTPTAVGHPLSLRYALEKQRQHVSLSARSPNRAFKGGKLDALVNISLRVQEMVWRQNAKWFHILKRQQQDTAWGKDFKSPWFLSSCFEIIDFGNSE